MTRRISSSQFNDFLVRHWNENAEDVSGLNLQRDYRHPPDVE